MADTTTTPLSTSDLLAKYGKAPSSTPSNKTGISTSQLLSAKGNTAPKPDGAPGSQLPTTGFGKTVQKIGGGLKSLFNSATSSERNLGGDIATGANNKLYTDAKKQHDDLLTNLSLRIASDTQSGKDTSKLTEAMQQLQKSEPTEKDFAAEKPSTEKLIGDIAGTAVDVASVIPGVGVAEEVGKKSLTELAKSGAKVGAAYGAGTAASGAMSEDKSAGDVVKAGIGGGTIGAVTGGTLGPVAGKVADIFAPKAEKVAADVTEKSGKSTFQKLFGDEAAAKREAKKDPIAQEFASGKRTVADTTSKVEKGIKSFVQKSKASLEKVFDKLPKNVTVKSSDITEAVNKGIQNVVGGLEKSSGAKLRTMEDLLTKTKFSKEEQGIVKNLVDRVKGWTNNTPRGIAELRRVLQSEFSRGDGSLSDKVVSKVNAELKDVISKSSKEYGPALAKAVENIDKVSSVSKGLVDKTGKVDETKLLTLARKLRDPAQKATAKKALQEVLGDSYDEVIKELQGFNNYETLNKIKSNGLFGKVKTAATIVGGAYGTDKISKAITGIGF